MAQWFYDRDGIEHGPVSETALGTMYARGALTDETLVWPVEAPERRTTLAASGVTLPPRDVATQPAAPAPPVPHLPATAPQPAAAAASDDEAFFGSPLVRAYVGKNADTYIDRWRKMHAKSGGNWEKTMSQTSWNWSAFLIPYAWTLYRKMWLPGAGVLALLIAVNFAGEKAARLVGIGVCVAFAIMANALYLRQVRAFWSANRTNTGADARAASEGGTNRLAGIGGAVVLSIAAIIAGTNAGEFADIFGAGATCSGRTTQDLVAEIAREQMTKQGLGYLGMDIAGTKVSLEAIRTQNDRGRKTECAATIKYDVKLAPTAKPDANPKGLGDYMQADITYTVENTDDGKNIYVTVSGLKQ